MFSSLVYSLFVFMKFHVFGQSSFVMYPYSLSESEGDDDYDDVFFL